jgi:hypothetical protein
VSASVTEIEEFPFKECIGLEERSIHKEAVLTAIGQQALRAVLVSDHFMFRRKLKESERTVSKNVFLDPD